MRCTAILKTNLWAFYHPIWHTYSEILRIHEFINHKNVGWQFGVFGWRSKDRCFFSFLRKFWKYRRYFSWLIFTSLVITTTANSFENRHNLFLGLWLSKLKTSKLLNISNCERSLKAKNQGAQPLRFHVLAMITSEVPLTRKMSTNRMSYLKNVKPALLRCSECFKLRCSTLEQHFHFGNMSTGR